MQLAKVVKLGEIALVRSGLVLARKQAKGADCVQYPLLTLRSLNEAGYIDAQQLESYNAVEALMPEYVSHEGDLIVRLSAPYTSVLIDEKTAGMVISSNFIIIRTDKERLLPEYMFWLLNTKRVKRKLYEEATGVTMGAVKARFFAEIEIEMLPMADQQRMAEIYRLARRETQLLRKLATEREKYYTCLLNAVQKDMRRDNKDDQ